MLLQHHTASLLDPQPSPEWDEEMMFGVGERPRGGTKKKATKRGRGVKEGSEEGEAQYNNDNEADEENGEP